MKAIVRESLKSIETHLNNERQAQYGMNQGKILGGFCRVMTRDRSYFIEFIVDDKIERVYVDVYPQIVVEKPFRFMTHAYVNEKTSNYKSGRIDIDDDNGELKVRVEASIVDHAVSVNDIKDMEHLAIQISDGLERRLDKMAHGVPFRDDDPELMSDGEKKMANLKKKLRGGQDSDTEDSDPFIELLKKMSSIVDDDSDDDSDSADEDLSAILESIDFEDKTDDDSDGVDVVLESYGENKFYVIKCVRDISGVSLPEAKRMVESAPITILKSVSREKAESAINRLKAEGATAEIR